MNRQHEEIIKEQINRIMKILDIEYPDVFTMNIAEGNSNYYIQNNVLGTVHIGNYRATAEFLLGVMELLITELHRRPVDDLEEFK